MKHEPAIAEVHLTWEIFAEIWQLAVSDRKRLALHPVHRQGGAARRCGFLFRSPGTDAV